MWEPNFLQCESRASLTSRLWVSFPLPWDEAQQVAGLEQAPALGTHLPPSLSLQATATAACHTCHVPMTALEDFILKEHSSLEDRVDCCVSLVSWHPYKGESWFRCSPTPTYALQCTLYLPYLVCTSHEIKRTFLNLLSSEVKKSNNFTVNLWFYAWKVPYFPI